MAVGTFVAVVAGVAVALTAVGHMGRFWRVVRCTRGHLLTTLWVPGGSAKAVRFGRRGRWQWCPVGHHMAMVRRVDATTLSPIELSGAQATRDLPIA